MISFDDSTWRLDRGKIGCILEITNARYRKSNCTRQTYEQQHYSQPFTQNTHDRFCARRTDHKERKTNT